MEISRHKCHTLQNYFEIASHSQRGRKSVLVGQMPKDIKKLQYVEPIVASENSAVSPKQAKSSKSKRHTLGEMGV